MEAGEQTWRRSKAAVAGVAGSLEKVSFLDEAIRQDDQALYIQSSTQANLGTARRIAKGRGKSLTQGPNMFKFTPIQQRLIMDL